MAATYSFPSGTITSDSLIFRENLTQPLSIFEIESNLVFLNNLTLSGAGKSSGVIYKAKSSQFDPTGGDILDIEGGKFGVQVLKTNDLGEPLQLMINFSNESVIGNRKSFWQANQSPNIERETFDPPDQGGPISTLGVCPSCTYECGRQYYANGCYIVDCCCLIICSNCVPVSSCEETCPPSARPGANLPEPPKGPKRILRLSRISGEEASEETFDFTLDGLIQKEEVSVAIISAPPSNGDVTYGICKTIECCCSGIDENGNDIPENCDLITCCWWQPCIQRCKSRCNQLVLETPNPDLSNNNQSISPCPSCKKVIVNENNQIIETISASTSPDYGPLFFTQDTSYLISIVELENTSEVSNIATSTNNSIIYKSINQIIPAIDTTPTSGYSSTAFTWGRFNSALTKVGITLSTYTSSSTFTSSVSSTQSFPNFTTPSREFDYKLIGNPSFNSGLLAEGRFYYQLILNRTHPNGQFNSMLNSLDNGYRINLNFQVSTFSILGTYSGPRNFTTILHSWATLSNNVMNILMSSTHSLPNLRRSRSATMSFNGTRIFNTGNEYQLSFNQFSDITTSTFSIIEDSFWYPLIQSTNDKILTIQQSGAINNWKFRISATSSKVKTKSRALANGKNVFEYIFSRATLASTTARPGILPSLIPNTFPSNQQYTISYSDYIPQSLGQGSYTVVSSSIFGTSSTYSFYLSENLNEGEIAIKQNVETIVTYKAVDSITTTKTGQFTYESHLNTDELTTSASFSQPVIAMNPREGGQLYPWFEDLEKQIRKGGIKVITKDGSTMYIPSGKPPRLNLNLNYCPPCPDGKTLNSYIGSLTYLNTGDVILGNDVFYEIRNMGDFLEICQYVVRYDDTIVPAELVGWEFSLPNTFTSIGAEDQVKTLETNRITGNKFFFRFKLGGVADDVTSVFGSPQQIPITVEVLETSPSVVYWGWAFFSTEGKVKVTCAPRGWSNTTLEDISPMYGPSIYFDYAIGDIFYFDWDGITARWYHNGDLVAKVNKNTDWPGLGQGPDVPDSPVSSVCFNPGMILEDFAHQSLSTQTIQRLNCWFESTTESNL